MRPPDARIVEGRKFMWDGRVYSTREDAAKAKTGYESDGFEAWTCGDEGTFLVYTRRAVRQTTAEAPH